MGVNNSTLSTAKGDEKKPSFYEIIDYISTKYIMTSNFQSLTRLQETEYCNDLIVLTSDIIEQNFTDLEISFLDERVKTGLDKDKVLVLNTLTDNEHAHDPLKKRAMCIGIAKFYIKIAHVYAAIVMTMNPVYVYTDQYGNVVKNPLSEKKLIPPNVQTEIYKMGLCNKRINALKRNSVTSESGSMMINPEVCTFNSGPNGDPMSLSEEPGINEFASLYFDEYDYRTGEFVGMKEETVKKYRDDLKKFYTVFTENEELPQDVTRFSDIRLRDFANSPGCKNDKLLDRSYTGNTNPNSESYKEDKETNDLFTLYAENLKKMMQLVNQNQEDLLNIINKLFTYIQDESGEHIIRVNPELTEELLQKIVEETRSLIMGLYLQCENDYVEGIQIYQAIVEKKIHEASVEQVKSLEKQSTLLLNGLEKK
jgi:hypothetical protein